MLLFEMQAHLPELLCAMLLSQSCLLGAAPPIHFPANGNGDKVSTSSFVPNREAYRLNPYRIASDTLRQVLVCAGLNQLAEPLNQFHQLENSADLATFGRLVAGVAALVTVHAPAQLPKFLFYLNQALKSNYDRHRCDFIFSPISSGVFHSILACISNENILKKMNLNISSHRLVGVSFYAELIHQRCGGREAEMLETIIVGLTTALPDSSSLIRRLVLKGLGGLGMCDPRHLRVFCPTVLNALMDGLEEDGHEKDDGSGTAREALQGLKRLIPVAPSAEIERLASRLALRVRPFFEHHDANVRQVAVALLSDLFQAGSSTPAKIHLTEQVGHYIRFKNYFANFSIGIFHLIWTISTLFPIFLIEFFAILFSN